MSEFRLRIPIQVCDATVPVKPRVWKDDYLHVTVNTDRADDAVRLVQKAISQMVERDSQRRISVVADGER